MLSGYRQGKSVLQSHTINCPWLKLKRDNYDRNKATERSEEIIGREGRGRVRTTEPAVERDDDCEEDDKDKSGIKGETGHRSKFKELQ